MTCLKVILTTVFALSIYQNQNTQAIFFSDVSASNRKVEVVFASAGGAVTFFFIGLFLGLFAGGILMHFYIKKKKVKLPSSPLYSSGPKENQYVSVPQHEKQRNTRHSTPSWSIGTLKLKLNNSDTSTLKSNNGHGKQNGHVEDPYE